MPTRSAVSIRSARCGCCPRFRVLARPIRAPPSCRHQPPLAICLILESFSPRRTPRTRRKTKHKAFLSRSPIWWLHPGSTCIDFLDGVITVAPVLFPLTKSTYYYRRSRAPFRSILWRAIYNSVSVLSLSSITPLLRTRGSAAPDPGTPPSPSAAVVISSGVAEAGMGNFSVAANVNSQPLEHRPRCTLTFDPPVGRGVAQLPSFGETGFDEGWPGPPSSGLRWGISSMIVVILRRAGRSPPVLAFRRSQQRASDGRRPPAPFRSICGAPRRTRFGAESLQRHPH